MDWMKIVRTSTEVWTGAALIAAGIAALCLGVHGILAQALVPFGVGLILSEVVGTAAREARARAKVRVRREDDN